jgi:hypothetical protein
MAALVMTYQVHVALLVPRNLPRPVLRAIEHRLDSFRFRLRLARAIREVVREHHDLQEVRFRFSL